MIFRGFGARSRGLLGPSGPGGPASGVWSVGLSCTPWARDGAEQGSEGRCGLGPWVGLGDVGKLRGLSVRLCGGQSRWSWCELERGSEVTGSAEGRSGEPGPSLGSLRAVSSGSEQTEPLGWGNKCVSGCGRAKQGWGWEDWDWDQEGAVETLPRTEIVV